MKGLRKLSDAELELSSAGMAVVARVHIGGCSDCSARGVSLGLACDEFEALMDLRSDLLSESRRRSDAADRRREQLALEGA